MAIELHIDGLFEMHIKNVHSGESVDKETELGVLDNLQQGEYVIGVNSKNIFDINDLVNPIYSFELDATDSLEYMFENGVQLG